MTELCHLCNQPVEVEPGGTFVEHEYIARNSGRLAAAGPERHSCDGSNETPEQTRIMSTRL